MTKIEKTINSLAAIQAAELLKSLLAHCYQIDFVEFVAKIRHREITGKSDAFANELTKQTSMITYKDGVTEVVTQRDEITG
jgi:hypothetical protein